MQDVREARSLEGSVYVSEKIYQRELDKIFYSGWLLVCHTDQISNVGDVFVQQIGDKSIFIVHAERAKYLAFHNVCRHRGTLLLEENSNQNVIQCSYHGWTYRLNGELVGCPDMEETRNFNKREYPLHQVDLEVWNGFVFVNLDPNKNDRLEVHLGDFVERFSKYRTEELKHIGCVGSYDISCNWKVYMENFNECYHCSLIHPETLGKYAKQHIPFDPAKIRGPYSMYYFDDRVESAKAADLGPLSGYPERTQGSTRKPEFTEEDFHRIYLPTLFPNSGMAICPEYVVLYQCWPVNVSRCKVHLEFFSPPDLLCVDRKESMKTLDMINLQDKRIVEMTQRGLDSGVFNGGRFSVWEKSVHHFQQLYTQALENH